MRERRAQEGQDDFERLFNLEAGSEAGPGGEREAPAYQFKVEKDILYYQGPGYDSSRHRLDLYIPQGVNAYPAMVFVHGGSWKFGDKDDQAGTSRALAEAFAAKGAGVASINHRLYPEVMHPEQVKDAARAFSWVVNNISHYGGDPGRVFTSGHSAGGHLAALAALDERYPWGEGMAPPAVKGAVVISGLYDLRVIQESSPRYSESLLAVFGSDPHVLEDASPRYHVRPDAPPFLILHADRDLEFMADQARGFYTALKAEGVDTEQHEEGDRNHITIVSRMGTVGDAATSQIYDFVSRVTGANE